MFFLVMETATCIKSKIFMADFLTIATHSDNFDMTNVSMLTANTALTIFQAVIKPFVIFKQVLVSFFQWYIVFQNELNQETDPLSRFILGSSTMFKINTTLSLVVVFQDTFNPFRFVIAPTCYIGY